MAYQTNPYLIWQILPGFLMFGLGLYILSRPHRRREANNLAAFLFGGTVWSLSNAIQWTSSNPAWQSFWNTFTYIGILVVPTAWIFLVSRFTGYFLPFVKRYRPVFLAVPLITYLAILTNPLHYLFFSALTPSDIAGFVTLSVEWGPLFYVHTAYSYLLISSGMALLVYGLAKNFKKYGIHAYGLIAGVVTPLVGNAVYLFGSFPADFPDPTPIMFTVTGVTFAWAIIGSKIFETVPLVHSAIVGRLSTGIIVLDTDLVVLDVNPAALRLLFGQVQDGIGLKLADLFAPEHPFIQAVQPLVRPGLAEEQSAEFFLAEDDFSCEATVRPVEDNFGDPAGYLIQLRDISQIRQVEEDLAITQETFDSVLDTLVDSYYETDLTGVILNANKAFVANLGFTTKEEVIGRHFRNFTHRDSVRDIFKKFAEVYATKQPLEAFEYNYRARDGKTYVGEMFVSPILDKDNVIGARGMIRNVTDRVMAEREMAAQKDFLDGLMKNAPFAIVVTDLDNQITLVNPAFEKLFGYMSDEVLAKRLSDFLLTPEISAEIEALPDQAPSAELYITTRRQKKDGDWVDVEIYSVPFYLHNEEFGTIVFYNDITERLKAEADLTQTETDYRAILETLRDPYVEVDPEGRFTYVNQGLLDAVGISSKEQVIGRHFRRIVARKNIRGVADKFRNVFATKKPTDLFELIYMTDSGEELTSEMIVSPVLEDGEVVGARGILRDISERIKVAETLRQAKEEAEHRAGELAAINRVSVQVSESLDLDEILQSVCQELTRIFPVRNAGIGLLDVSETSILIRAFHSIDPEEKSAIGIVLPLEGNAATQEVIRTKRTTVIRDAQADPRTASYSELSKERGTKSIMIVPLLTRGQVIGTVGMPAKDMDHQFTENDIALAGTIASQIASAVDNAVLYSRTETALGAAESDLEIGSQIQSGFFPDTLPQISGWEIATHFHSARQVAGDFYDIFQFPRSRHTAFVIADVCDKGVGAALFMVLFRSLLRAFSDVVIDPGRIAEQLLGIILKTNNYVAEIHGHSSMFATLFFGILDPDSGVLYYINGGHEAPVVLDRNGEIKSRLMPTGPAVGLFPDLPYEVGEILFDPGDILVGFTDGTTDARDSTGDLYSEERLLASIQSPWTSIFSMLFELQTQLKNHIGEQVQYDDITLISFRRKLAEEADYHAVCRPADMALFEELRAFVEAAALHNGLAESDVFAFKLAAEEILTNIIQYGYEGRDPGMIVVGFECDSDTATLKIWDDGNYFAPAEAAAPDLELGWEERKIGGLGIFFVNELMDRVAYSREDNQTNLLVLEKKRTGQA